MIHIAICDDEQNFIDHLRQLLDQYTKQTGTRLKITPYSDGMQLIERYDPTIDLIFLDIQMKVLDGLHAAGQVRRLAPDVGIIFLTTLSQYSLEGYQYQAAGYIIKPIAYARLKSELDRFAAQRRSEAGPAVIVANDAGKYKISLRTLRYIETFGRNLLFHTEQQNIVCYKRMKEAEKELLGQGFARCHTSYMANLFYVKGVKKLELELITGEVLPISQPKRKQFMEQLTEYWGARL